MNFAAWSIRSPIPSILLFIFLSLAGVLGFRQLGVQDMPDLDMPTVAVKLRLPGAAPAQLETEVARKVEDQLATLQGVKHLLTSVNDGQLTILVEFQLERNLSDAVTDVKDAVDRIRNTLPADLEAPQITRVALSTGGPMATYALESRQMDEEALSWFVDSTVAQRVLAVRGIGEFRRVGGGQREVQVEVDPTRLTALGLTAADVSRALRRVQQDSSGGRGQLGGAEQGMRTVASVRQAADLAALPVAIAGERWIRLDEVARIHDTLADRTQAALLDGRPAVGFQVLRAKGFNDLEVSAQLEQAIQELRQLYPDLHIERISTTADNTRIQYEASMKMLWEGSILAMLVVWVFLRDWRATMVGAAALPLSILPAFAFMALMGYNLNTVTLMAISVVVGILVDDAIVEVENIAWHMREGKSAIEATVAAVEEIALPVIATTLALVVVFLPTAFMVGLPGMIFKQFGWTAVAAILASLLVARLATPMMAAHFLRAAAHEPPNGWLMWRYLHLVRWCLDHRKTTLLLSALVFAGSLALIPLIPTGFIPASDKGTTTLNVELPPGASLNSTLAACEDARQALSGIPGIQAVFTTVGQVQAAGVSPLRAGEVRRGQLMLTLTPAGTRPSQTQIEKQVRTRLDSVPGARFSLDGNGPGQKLVLVLTSRDNVALREAAQAVETQLRTLPFLSGVTSTASLERPEVVVKPDPALTAERGVSTQAIADTVRIATSGDFGPALAKLNLDARQIDIRVRLPDTMRADLASLGSLRVASRSGLIPLDSVASLTLASGPAQIDRHDRSRNVVLRADLGGFPLGEAIKRAHALPAMQGLPSSVKVIGSGDAEFMAELFTGVSWAMGIGILCIYAVLVLLFKDFLQPLTILSALPLSVSGAFVALLSLKGELGLPALIGLVMLLGIVTKNSILLVEFAIVAIRDHGKKERRALFEACQKRARPIIMTTVAMVAGMLPLALGLTGDSSFRQPMAMVVIGGLLTSTALSLVVVPVVFTYIAALQRRLGRSQRRRSKTGGDTGQHAHAQLDSGNSFFHSVFSSSLSSVVSSVSQWMQKPRPRRHHEDSVLPDSLGADEPRP